MEAHADYRDILSLAEALAKVLGSLEGRGAATPQDPPVEAGGPETVCLEAADGRVLAAEVRAADDVPGFARSTVDGYAVSAADTFGAAEAAPALLFATQPVVMGRPAPAALVPGQAAAIPTGGMLPPGADAVVMVERTVTPGEGLVEVLRPVAPGENVVQRGEDVAAGRVVYRPGRRLTPADLGVLAAVGITDVPCHPRPRVAVIPTGDEIVAPGDPCDPGQVRDITSAALRAYVARDGGVAEVFPVVPDAEGRLEGALGSALQGFDLILILGGSSVGARDRTAAVIDELGPPGVVFHGLALKPGKPTIFGLCGRRAVPVFGLPGHPVSGLVVYRLLVRPALRVIGGEQPPAWRPVGPGEDAGSAGLEPALTARLTSAVSSDQGRDDYLCVRLRFGPEGLLAEPVHGKSGLITMLAGADGLVHIPAGERGLEEGTMVRVFSLV